MWLHNPANLVVEWGRVNWLHDSNCWGPKAGENWIARIMPFGGIQAEKCTQVCLHNNVLPCRVTYAQHTLLMCRKHCIHPCCLFWLQMNSLKRLSTFSI